MVSTIPKGADHIHESFLNRKGCDVPLTVNPTMTHVRLDAVERFYQDYHRILGYEATDETLLMSSSSLWFHYFENTAMSDEDKRIVMCTTTTVKRVRR